MPCRPADPAPAPLEAYCQQFDGCFRTVNQRNAFRRYLAGLLLPAERNKTLTALAHAEPIVGAQQPGVQRLQWFLSESSWQPAALNQRRHSALGYLSPVAFEACNCEAVRAAYLSPVH